ncbi:M48 family metalloprotease [Hydrocarboniclastica marina]|uniref:Peptidase M48 n=1 Tax=Hydrocarboniclastica marina TaxID=2259620 RepID=A0A4P7XFM3_9ALTE|nr:M48 family metalloprotease [Hydrocarboniclastica marina]QCF25761.1 peptidase M48 [Hydrocarboniclastica marina]
MSRINPARATLLALCLIVISLAGCSTNPVTGERELRLISGEEERSIGEQQYQPTLQSQGGEYTIDEELSEYVSNIGQKLAAQSDRPDLPYEFTVLNNGVPNAWALPGGKIAINRGLLMELENEAQLAAVLSHEIVHAAAGHSAQRMQQGMLLNAGMAGLGLAVADNDYAQMLIGGAALGAQLTMAKYGRGHELESDRYGMEYMAEAGYDPQEAVELQRIFVRLSEGQDSDFISGLFASHPPSMARVEANEKTARELGADGRIGAETYQEKTAYLRKIQPAYDLEQQALALAKQEQYSQALAKINQALEIVPDEPSFNALRGQLLKATGKPDAAIASLNKAVNLYPEMFSFRLQRGLIHKEMGHLNEAREDLKASAERVPTSLAFLGLGELAQTQGRPDAAREYFKVAASGGGRFSEQAQARLNQLNQ